MWFDTAECYISDFYSGCDENISDGIAESLNIYKTVKTFVRMKISVISAGNINLSTLNSFLWPLYMTVYYVFMCLYNNCRQIFRSIIFLNDSLVLIKPGRAAREKPLQT